MGGGTPAGSDEPWRPGTIIRMPIPRIIARPYGGTNPELNRREYLLARVMQTPLHQIARNVDTDSDTVDGALAYFDPTRRSVTGPAFQKQVNHFLGLTFHQGIQNAQSQLSTHHQERIRKRFAAPQTLMQRIAPFTPILPALIPQQRSAWSNIIDALTQHVVDHWDRIADDLKDRLTSSLQEGYSMGEVPTDLADRVQALLNIDMNSANRISRTMTMETYNQAHIIQYKQSGVPGIRWMATPDERECDICADLDGTVWSLDDPDLMYPPAHEFCRCTVVSVVDENDIPDESPDINEDTRAFYDAFDKRFDVPLYAE